MSRYITTAIIFILTVFIIVFSRFYINDACKKIYELTDETKHFLELSEFQKAENALMEISEYIDIKKSGFMMIIEHEYTESLEVKINKARSFTLSQEKALALAELSEARDMISDIKNSQKFSAANIL